MNYTIYDLSEQSPSLAERDVIWSVLLFGDKIEITSGLCSVFYHHAYFKLLDDRAKFESYKLFRVMIEKFIPWDQFENYFKTLRKLQQKNKKTALEMNTLKELKAWSVKNENWFVLSLKENLEKYNLEEIAPLTVHLEGEPEPDIVTTLPMEVVNTKHEESIFEHFILIITKALSQTNNMFVLDERILPFIANHPIVDFSEEQKQTSEKVVVFSEKVFEMPLCYTLKSSDVMLARNELKPSFMEFHELIHSISKGEEHVIAGMEKIRLLLPGLQHKIENSNFVQKVHNREKAVEKMNLHLAFTSNRRIVTLLKQLGMLTEEQLLQANEILVRESKLDQLHPFMFITH